MEVIINGIRYVPVMESNPNMNAIAKGLLTSFWGGEPKDDKLKEEMEGMYVSVNDWKEGVPIEDVLVDISNALRNNMIEKEGRKEHENILWIIGK